MQRQLTFSITDKDNMDGALTAYVRQWLIITASELGYEKRTLTALADAVGTTRQRISRWLDALQIREQIEDKALLRGAEHKEPLKTRQISFSVMEQDLLDGAITSYAREWLLLAASELPADECTLERLATKVGTNRQRVARWLDALQIREEVDAMRSRLAPTG
jgi:CTP-dependent riboflavin kinase